LRTTSGRYRLGFTLLVIASICAADALRHSAQANELQSGIAAYERGDYARALKILTPLAERGDNDAESHLGAMFCHGMGVKKDYVEALKWNRKAAEAGLPGAQTMLGQMYWAGLGVPKDYDEAAKWYRRAADQGWAEGQFGLAYMYLYGQGVPRDTEKAVELFRRAAQQDMALAQYKMGLLYYDGAIVAKNPAQANLWFSLALRGLDPGVFRVYRDDTIKAIQDLDRQMSADQRSEAERLLNEWRQSSYLTFEDLKDDAGEDCAEPEQRE
jgi:TPR repeat protein